MNKKKIAFLAIMIGAAAIFVLLIALLPKNKKTKDELVCVTSFYPVYLLAESVSEGVEGVQVTNLTENHSGCIHDYTLTTGDMKLLSKARLFMVNGGGMELFLTKAAKDYKNLTIVDTSEDYDFLAGVGHHHEHQHEDLHEEDGHEEEEENVNSHIWLSVDGYLYQLQKVEDAFCKVDEANAEKYHKNAERCRENLNQLRADLSAAQSDLSGKQAIVFHEGFVYLLSMLSMETVHCLPMDADTQISAGEAAEIIDESKLHPGMVLFCEDAFLETISGTFRKETGAEIITLDALTGAGHSGQNSKDGLALYCKVMRENLKKIKEAYQ